MFFCPESELANSVITREAKRLKHVVSSATRITIGAKKNQLKVL